jgi:HPt (histidine-containing phosphotransfer) domain-containing protein
MDSIDDPVARAEAAFGALASEFTGWMQAECERLDAARRKVKRLGFTAAAHGSLFRAAHDIKGEAASFGFPEAADIAASLCRLLEYTPARTAIPLKLVDRHVAALRAIIRDHGRPDAGDAARKLTQRLCEVTDAFLKRENAFRPDYLERIFTPPLAPD